MTNDSTPVKQNEPMQTSTQNESAQKQERFSEAYKRALDGVTMSPELRERVLRLQNRKPEPLFLRVIRPAACVAACLAIAVTAQQLTKADKFQLSTANTTAAVNETLSSAALFSSTQADYSPEAAYDTAGIETSDSSSAAVPESYDIAEDGPSAGRAYDGTETASPEDAPAQLDAVPEDENDAALPAGTESRIEPYVLSASTDLPENAPEESSSVTQDETPSENGGLAPQAEEQSSKIELNAASADDPNKTDDHTMVSNPITVYVTLSEAESVLGWNAKLPPVPYEYIQITLINGNLLQIQWNDGLCYYRMAKAELGDDISGDYNTYSASAIVENGYTLQLRGNAENAYTLLTWQADGYSYAYSCNTPMTADEAIILVEGVLGE